MDRLTFEAAYALDGNTLSGVAHVFGTTAIKGGTRQRFAAEAFNKSIREHTPMAFYSHDTSKPLASMETGTLKLSVRDSRLYFEMELGDQSYAEDLRKNHAAGLMRGMSFGVLPVKSELRRDKDGPYRFHTESGLYDISPVAIPAFDGTEAQLHSADLADDRRDVLIRARHRARRATWAT